MQILKEIICNTIFLYYRLESLFNKNEQITNEKTVVFLRTAEIGDFILFLHAGKLLAEYYSDYKKILICNEPVKILATKMNIWDEIVVFNRKKYKSSVKYRKEKNKEIKKITADILLNVEYSRTMYTEIISTLIRAKEKVAFEGDTFTTDFIKKLSDKKIRTILKMGIEDSELKKNAEFASELIGEQVPIEMVRLPHISDISIIKDEQYYVLFPGASYLEKAWNEKKFIELIEYIGNQYGITCCLCGSKAEEAIATQIENSIDSNIKLYNLVGRTTLIEVFGIVENAEFVVGNDSACIHIAAGYRVPSVAISGQWDMNRFLPYPKEISEFGMPRVARKDTYCKGCSQRKGEMGRACGVKPMQGDGKKFKCIDMIQTKDVIKLIDELIKTSYLGR